MRSFMLAAALTALGAAGAEAAGYHFGEFKDLAVDVEYFDYAYRHPSGEPVYYIGSNMRYRVTLKNNGNRNFSNMQLKSTLVWARDASCTRWWYDNQSASFKAGEPLPGPSSTGYRTAMMGPGGSAAIDASYFLPLSLCPGKGEILVEGRHRNNSGKEDVGSFRIPVGVDLSRR